MAVWGKGDPRWIVEERPDSTNVNNWHWTERNATNWSINKIQELFSELKETSDEGSWHVNEVTTVDGEATINNRKGKLIYFYEWNIKLNYKGTVNGSLLEYSGTIDIPNLSDENSAEDVDVLVRGKEDSENENTEKLKHLVRKNGIRMCREKCEQYVNDIKTEYSVGMVLPTPVTSNTQEEKQNNDTNTTNLNTSKKVKVTQTIPNFSVPESKNASRNVSINQDMLKLQEEFKTTADELYATLTQAERLSIFTRSQCISNPIPGGEFSIMNGNICGSYVTLIPNKEIVQKWRLKEWPEDVFSTVTIFIEQKSEDTILKLVQQGVPNFDVVRTKDGWLQHFWGPIKRTFGFGPALM